MAMRAFGSPNPGTGLPQYVSFRKAARFSRAMRSQYRRRREQRSQLAIVWRTVERFATPITFD